MTQPIRYMPTNNRNKKQTNIAESGFDCWMLSNPLDLSRIYFTRERRKQSYAE